MFMKYLAKCLPRLYPSSCIPLLPLQVFISSALQLSCKFPKQGCVFCVLPPVWLKHFWAIKQSNKGIELSRATYFTSHTAEFDNFESRKPTGKEVCIRRSKHRQRITIRVVLGDGLAHCWLYLQQVRALKLPFLSRRQIQKVPVSTW